MEDTDLRNIFAEFQPKLSDDRLFISRLHERLELIENVMQYRARLRRESRIAVAVAAAMGFITGIIFTLLLPLLQSFAAYLLSGISSITIYQQPMASVISWCILALAVMMVSIYSYRFLFARIRVPGFE